MITKPKPGAMLNPLHPLSKGLVACWLMNEGAGSLINDISGNKNHGSLKNMAPNVQGSGWGGSKFGGGLKFDGVNDYVEITNSSSSEHSLDLLVDFTITAWTKINTFPSYSTIVAKRGLAGYQYQFRLLDNDLSLLTTGGSRVADANLIAGVEYYITVTRINGGNIVFYVDGIPINTQSSLTINHIDVDVSIGANDNAIHQFDGSIDSVRIYNRALSAEEVRLSYEQPFCMMMTPRITTLLKMLGSLDKNNQFLLDSLNCKVMQLGNTRINTWNTLGRPTAKRGIIGFNTTTNKIEVYDGSAWKSVSLS